MITFYNKLMPYYLKYFIILIYIVLYSVYYNVDYVLQRISVEFVGMICLTISSIVIICLKKRYSFNALDALFIIFTLWYSCSILWTNDTFNRWSLLGYITILLLYFCIRSIDVSKYILHVIFIIGIFQMIWYILQLCLIIPSRHYLFDGTGSFFNPALLGLYITITLIAIKPAQRALNLVANLS